MTRILIIESLNGRLDYSFESYFKSVFPAWEIIETEVDGKITYSRGDEITHPTYAQVIACNFLADYPHWPTKKMCNDVINGSEWLYNPRGKTPLGREIETNPSMIGKKVRFINVVDPEIERDLETFRKMYEDNGGVINFPISYTLTPEEAYSYFTQVENGE